MKESIIDIILSSTGYLPPRNEKEMEVFETIYSNVKIDKTFHVDVDSIMNGGCRVKPVFHTMGRSSTGASDIRMAARNYEAMPKELIEKIKSQHKSKDDKSE